MRATIRIPEDELAYPPRALVVPHGGTLELTLINVRSDSPEPQRGGSA